MTPEARHVTIIILPVSTPHANCPVLTRETPSMTLHRMLSDFWYSLVRLVGVPKVGGGGLPEFQPPPWILTVPGHWCCVFETSYISKRGPMRGQDLGRSKRYGLYSVYPAHGSE
ncbi:hypothetical protein EVAR_38546_1 [Eumeta japonica]|uniref:Uncharacterized protein n=1 Tax=Eumeta variegata TaxID=151549 RepID=A0A4C1WBY1_EUMVA|nr:hypothetical protein EVAR_38546_1 [Eumeta japonica]